MIEETDIVLYCFTCSSLLTLVSNEKPRDLPSSYADDHSPNFPEAKVKATKDKRTPEELQKDTAAQHEKERKQ
jgi:hypothetical protein